jgi:signal transduction histidine kinase
VRRAATEFEQGQQARKHRFEVETGTESPAVHADPEALRCVFWNLFENAVKYSPECDTVWVKLARNGRHIEVAVRDRGVGIPPGEQRRIFEKFVRGSAARQSNVRGTGVGLAMARQIVRAHGGEITVESEPGQGSTFRVLLPVSPERKFTTDEHGQERERDPRINAD